MLWKKKERFKTCAIEAEAIGVGSIYSYKLSIGLPNSWRKIVWMSSKGTEGALSKHFWNSSTYSGGNNVGADAMNWQNVI